MVHSSRLSPCVPSCQAACPCFRLGIFPKSTFLGTLGNCSSLQACCFSVDFQTPMPPSLGNMFLVLKEILSLLMCFQLRPLLNLLSGFLEISCALGEQLELSILPPLSLWTRNHRTGKRRRFRETKPTLKILKQPQRQRHLPVLVLTPRAGTWKLTVFWPVVLEGTNDPSAELLWKG